MHSKLLGSACAAALLLAPPLTGQTVVDGRVTRPYPPSHWGSAPAADLTGTEPALAADVLVEMGWWYRVDGDTREYWLRAPDSQAVQPDGALRSVWNNLDGMSLYV